MTDLLKHVEESGFPHKDRLIHVFVGGSELHGAKVHGTDDLDIYGVYIEPPDQVLGLESFPHFIWSTAGNDRRNGPADVDVTLYSLKKWAGLACKGNPTALHFLFAAGVLKSPLWSFVVKRKQAFLSRLCAKHFIGFANDQFGRLTGRKGRGKKGQRPELEEKYGYDVKAAMHGLRLLYECEEVLRSGTITLPRPERDLLVRVRTGKYSLEKVVEMADRLALECTEAENKSMLPAKVDRKAVSEILAECYLRSWRG
jgi:predicted nucleotidyltransferase